jgi:glycerol uptake facilitator-like aquaporin
MTSSARALAAEFIGTAALLAVVVGSGIMAERLSPANAGVALLANALATGLGLYVLITILGPVSRAHFNPVVTLAALVNGELAGALALGYATVQWIGAIAGVWLAHLMFDLPLLQTSAHARTGIGQWVSEAVATAGLLVTIGGCMRFAPAQVATAVGVYIASAYWFTASTSFANPAVTTARALTDTFAGIRPADVPAFVASQLVGMAFGLALGRVLFGKTLVGTVIPKPYVIGTRDEAIGDIALTNSVTPHDKGPRSPPAPHPPAHS